MSRRAAQSGEVEITYAPRLDATPGDEQDVLARVYEFVLRNHEKRKAAEPAPEPDAAVRVKYGEEVSHVEQRTR
jgi:hypothetical protein